jgi:hypothetical protein
MMRANLTYECGCLFTQDPEPWSQRLEGEVRASYVHSGPAGEADHAARRLGRGATLDTCGSLRCTV